MRWTGVMTEPPREDLTLITLITQIAQKPSTGTVDYPSDRLMGSTDP